MPDFFPDIREAIENDEPFAVVTVIRGAPVGKKIVVYEDGRVIGSIGDHGLDRTAIDVGRERLGDDASGVAQLSDQIDAFVDCCSPGGSGRASTQQK